MSRGMVVVRGAERMRQRAQGRVRGGQALSGGAHISTASSTVLTYEY